TTANTEYSYAILAGTSKILIKLRGTGATFQLSYILGESNTTFITIPANSSKEIIDIKGTGITLYFQSSLASQTMEIEVWR
ncbi:MAG: hypothetical protein AABY22_20515, partial [Nanoarchaeota archaeon]